MRISEVANITGLNVSNIRFYERKGLLTPVREEESKYRDYTEADVKKIRQILLYRKMGVSVDTIYLILNEQADWKDVLQRQKSELLSQIENLRGAAELCSLMLQEEEIDDEKLNLYLNYVYSEESKGRKFAEIQELLEDIVEYSKERVFGANPTMVMLLQRPRIAEFVAVVFWIMVVCIPCLHLVQVLMGKAQIQIVLLGVYAVIIVIHTLGFFAYRKTRKALTLYGKGNGGAAE